MSDPFQGLGATLTSPMVSLFEITPSDDDDLAKWPRVITAGVAGFVRVTTIKDDVVTIYVNQGDRWPVRVKKVWATGTDAEQILGGV